MGFFDFLRKKEVKKGKGYILSLDLSDFTSISEFLSEKGTEGTETLSKIISKRFDYIYEQIYNSRGKFIKFVGDEILAFFKDEKDANNVLENVINYFKKNQIIETPWGEINIGIKGVYDYGEIFVSRLHDINIFMGKPFGTIQKLKKGLPPFSIKKGISYEGKSKDLNWNVEKRETLPAEHRVSTVVFIQYINENLKNGKWQTIKKDMNYIYNTIQEKEGFLVDILPGDDFQLFLVLFGAPVSKEDDFKRAVELTKSVKKDKNIRTGIASGYVYAGSIGKSKIKSYTVLGDVVNETARIVFLPDFSEKIRVSENSLKNGIKWFDFIPLTTVQIKGKKETITIYEPVAKRETLEDKLFKYKLVGREKELEKIELLLFKKYGGIIFYGPPGIGKSRLLWEAKRRSKDMTVYETTAYENGGELHLLRNLLAQVFKIEENDLPQTIESKIDNFFTTYEIEGSIYIKDMVFGLEIENDFIKGLSPDIKLQNLYETFVKIIEKNSVSDISISLIIVEDIQWGDTTSLNFIKDLVMERKAITVISARPQYKKEIFPSPPFEHISLNPLGDVLWELGKEILGGAEIEEDVKEIILKRAEGNPFYLEQILLDLIETHYITKHNNLWIKTEKFSEERLPQNVFHAIQSRLDKLTPGTKEILKVGSVIGREFRKYLIKEVMGTDPDLLFEDAELKGLALKKIEKDEVEYLFKHAIVKDVIYESILMEEKKILHKKIADAILKIHENNLLPYIKEIINHYKKCGEEEKAFYYAKKGAEESKEKFLIEEAVSLYNECISLTKDTTEKIYFQCNLTEVLRKAGDIKEAESICNEVLGNPELEKDKKIKSLALLGMAEVKFAAEKIQEALTYAEKSKEIAEEKETLARINNLLGMIYLNIGEIEKSEKHYKESLSIYRELKNQKRIAMVLGNLFWYYAQIGQFNVAKIYHTEALSIMRQQTMKIDLIGTLLNSVSLYVTLNEFKKALEIVEEGIKEAEEINHTVALKSGYFMRGNIYRMLGKYRDAIKDYEKELTLSKKMEGIEDTNTLLNIGSLYRQIGVFKKSEEIFNKIKPEEKNKEILFNYYSEIAYQNHRKFEIIKMEENINFLESLLNELNPPLSFIAPYIVAILKVHKCIASGDIKEISTLLEQINEGVKQGMLNIVDIFAIGFNSIFFLDDFEIAKKIFEEYKNLDNIYFLQTFKLLKLSIEGEFKEIYNEILNIGDPFYGIMLGDIYMRKNENVEILKLMREKLNNIDIELNYMKFIVNYWGNKIKKEEKPLYELFNNLENKVKEKTSFKNTIFYKRIGEHNG